MATGFDFSGLPAPYYPRSKKNLSHKVVTSLKIGELVPLDVQEVVAGDSFNCNFGAVARLTSSFIKPLDVDTELDVFHFYVPYRILFDKFDKVFSQASPSQYTSPSYETVPSITGTVSKGSIGDYIGLPLGNYYNNHNISVLPFRAYGLIVDRFFRNQNVTNEVYVNKGYISLNEQMNDNPFSANNYCGQPFKVNKHKDYFTSCLPRPQKGDAVVLPLGTTAPISGEAFLGANIGLPVKPLSTMHSSNYQPKLMINRPVAGRERLQLLDAGGDSGYILVNSNDLAPTSGGVGGNIIGNNFYAVASNDPGNNKVDTSDLSVDLSSATALSVNDMRYAFQLQKILEREALYGSRINEYFLAHFGVRLDDARIQNPEFLGGGRIDLKVQQVAQTAPSGSASEYSPVGNLAGYSLTTGKTHYNRYFKEHGIVMTLGCIRYKHTYSEGIPKKFTRLTKNDFYDPLLANIGFQPVYKSELKFISGQPFKGNVFGYQPAWSELDYEPDRVTGAVRLPVSNSDSLGIWAVVDHYNNAPSLNDDFIKEDDTAYNDVISVETQFLDPFILSCYFDLSAVRIKPSVSIPGYIDH